MPQISGTVLKISLWTGFGLLLVCKPFERLTTHSRQKNPNDNIGLQLWWSDASINSEVVLPILQAKKKKKS